MNVVLPADLEKLVNESVERGDFANRDEFFRAAAQILLDLRRGDNSPLTVSDLWGGQLEALIEEAHASGPPIEMTDRDWDDVERKGRAVIEARKKGPA